MYKVLGHFFPEKAHITQQLANGFRTSSLHFGQVNNCGQTSMLTLALFLPEQKGHLKINSFGILIILFFAILIYLTSS